MLCEPPDEPWRLQTRWRPFQQRVSDDQIGDLIFKGRWSLGVVWDRPHVTVCMPTGLDGQSATLMWCKGHGSANAMGNGLDQTTSRASEPASEQKGSLDAHCRRAVG